MKHYQTWCGFEDIVVAAGLGALLWCLITALMWRRLSSHDRRGHLFSCALLVGVTLFLHHYFETERERIKHPKMLFSGRYRGDPAKGETP
jgi:hypothetical protein